MRQEVWGREVQHIWQRVFQLISASPSAVSACKKEEGKPGAKAGHPCLVFWSGDLGRRICAHLDGHADGRINILYDVKTPVDLMAGARVWGVRTILDLNGDSLLGSALTGGGSVWKAEQKGLIMRSKFRF
jgi:hypothetical protein